MKNIFRDDPSILFAEFHPWNTSILVGGHHYARYFAQDGWRVLWLANFININRLIRKNEYDNLYLQAWMNGVMPVDENIFTYTPFCYIPYIDFPILSSLLVGRKSLNWCLPSLSHTLSQWKFNFVDILWISQPRLYSLVDIVDHRVLAYRMFDDIKHFGGEPNSIGDVEKLLCQRADIVFATSLLLVEKAKKWCKNVVYLPNGVDVKRFNAPDLLIPSDLSAIPSPRLVYVGAISEWFDFETILCAAERKPDWSFVLIGPVSDTVRHHQRRFADLHNVHFLGSRSIDQVPAYMHHSDVALIPFQVNALTHSVSPIKLFEYSAAGLPVVAPELHEIKNCSSLVFFYNDVSGFIQAVQAGLNNRENLTLKNIQFGLSNSWDIRYQKVCEHILPLLDRR